MIMAMIQVAISTRLKSPPCMPLSFARLSRPTLVIPCFLIPSFPVATSLDEDAPIFVDFNFHQIDGSIRMVKVKGEEDEIVE